MENGGSSGVHFGGDVLMTDWNEYIVNSRPVPELTYICAACGYQWDDIADSAFTMSCPACDANMVKYYWPEKQEVTGADYDCLPWI